MLCLVLPLKFHLMLPSFMLWNSQELTLPFMLHVISNLPSFPTVSFPTREVLMYLSCSLYISCSVYVSKLPAHEAFVVKGKWVFWRRAVWSSVL